MVVILVAMLLNALGTAAQGTLHGTVTTVVDRLPAVQNGAHIIIHRDMAGDHHDVRPTDQVLTSANGGRFVVSLEPGDYDVCAMVDSFTPACKKVEIVEGKTVEIKLALEFNDLAASRLGVIPLEARSGANSFRVDLTGTWEFVMTSPEGPRVVDMALIQTGDRLTVEVMSEPSTSLRGTYDNETSRLRVFNQNVATSPMRVVEGTFDKGDGRIVGTATFRDEHVIGWIARRKPSNSRAASVGEGLTGTWAIQVGPIAGVHVINIAVLKQDGSAVIGSFGSSRSKLSGTVSSSTLRATICSSPTECVKFDGELRPDGSLKGTTVGDLGADVDWIGKRLRD